MPRKTWEYYDCIDGETPGIVELGKDGWELVSVILETSEEFMSENSDRMRDIIFLHFFLKREI